MSPTTSKILRWTNYVIAGLGVLLAVIIFFAPPMIPDCNSSDVFDPLAQVVEKLQPGATLERVGDQTETAYDEDAQVRTCKATAHLTGGASRELSYRLGWTNRDEKKFSLTLLTAP